MIPLLTSDLSFPALDNALIEPNGLLAAGGDLSPERLLAAYSQGVFPWFNEDDPILWWSPAPRAIFLPNEFKPSKSLRKFYRKSGYQITLNNACHDVIRQCADCRSPEETWITEDMIQAYQTMHNLGHCHSVEVWHQDKLVGGFYGLQIGSVFCGESMFSLANNASKIALWFFCRHFSDQGGARSRARPGKDSPRWTHEPADPPRRSCDRSHGWDPGRIGRQAVIPSPPMTSTSD